MQDSHQMFSRYIKIALNLLAAFALGWGFTSYDDIFLGLALGTIISTYNIWTVHRKVNHFGHAIVNKERARSLGTLQRMASAGLGVLIAMNFPEKVHLISVIIGLMTSYIVIMIDFFLQPLRKYFK